MYFSFVSYHRAKLCVSLSLRIREGYRIPYFTTLDSWLGISQILLMLGTYAQRGKRGIPGSSGHLTVKLWKKGSDKIEVIPLEYEKGSFSVSMRNALINLKTGYVKVSSVRGRL